MKLTITKSLLIFLILTIPSYLISASYLSSNSDIDSLRSKVGGLKTELEEVLKESREFKSRLDVVTQEIVGLKLEIQEGGITSFLTKRTLQTKLKQSKEIEIKLNNSDSVADSLSRLLDSTKDSLVKTLGNRIDDLGASAETRRKESDTEGLAEILEEILGLHDELFTYRQEVLEDTRVKGSGDFEITLESDDSEFEVRVKLDAVKQRKNKIQTEISLLEYRFSDLEIDKNLNLELLHLNQEMTEADWGLDFGEMSQIEELEEKILNIDRELIGTKDKLAKLQAKAVMAETLATKFEKRLREFAEAREKGGTNP